MQSELVAAVDRLDNYVHVIGQMERQIDGE